MNLCREVRPKSTRIAAIAAMVVLKLWLVAAQPVVAIGPAGHDDRLFLELANHVLHGEWLGPYSQFTLMKGPMYSFFIAGVWLLHLPLPLAQHLLYLAGCMLLIRALRPHLGPGAAFFLFALLWWNPMTYELPVLGRVLRQNFYTPTTLFFFAALVALATRQASSQAVRLSWAALLGVSGAALWLTREEGVWLFPSTALLIGAGGVIAWHAGRSLRPLLLPLMTAGIIATLGIVSVCTLNLRHYGWFGTVEFRAPEFIAAYGALQRVQSSYELPYVPVTRESRETAYRVSPAFAELQPFLEGQLGIQWAAPGESLTGRSRSEREIAGGWFMWALRDAVVAAGRAPDARSALAFYGRIAAEVNRACDRGEIAGGPRRDTLMPPWRQDSLRKLVAALPVSFHYFASFDGFDARPAQSVGPAWLLQLYSELTRWPLASSREAPELDRPPSRLNHTRIALLNGIGSGLRWVNLVAIYGALGGWLWLAVNALRTRTVSYALIVATSLLVAALAVVAINTLVDVMAFSNRSPGAYAQAYPLILAFAALIWIESTRPLARFIRPAPAP